MPIFRRSGRTALGLTLVTAAIAAPAFAGSLDLQISVASEEVFRGVVQNNSPTAALRIDYRTASRVYVGSRVLNNRSAGNAQVDLYAGYARSLIAFDLIPVGLNGGINVHLYTGDRRGPQGRDLDWADAYGSVDAGPARFSIAVAPDYFGTGAVGWRAAGRLRWPLTSDLEGTATLGWNDGEGLRRYTAPRGSGVAHADYSVALTQTLPHGFAVFGEITGATRTLDASARPRLLLGIHWRWGRQV